MRQCRKPNCSLPTYACICLCCSLACVRNSSLDPPVDGGAVCVAPCNPAKERRGVCSGQRPPAAINHRDGRSTAHEALRPTPASPGGGSYTGLKIHPSPPPPPATCQPLHSLEEGEIKTRRGGGRKRRRKKPVSTTGPYNTVFIANGLHI